MTRYEFIDVLQKALAGNISSSLINENIRYYEDYIDTKLRLGEKEEEVIENLGDPRLLAKTIIEAGKIEGRNGEIHFEDEEVYDENGYQGTDRNMENRAYRIPGWVFAVIAVVIIIVIIGAVTSLLSALLPILLPIICIVLVVRLIKNRG